MTTRAAAVSKARPGPTMKQYKPLLSSAPANSILNAQRFHYTNSASTDIRKTFANFRRNASKNAGHMPPGMPMNMQMEH